MNNRAGKFRKYYQGHQTATHLYKNILQFYCKQGKLVLDFGAGRGINNRLIPEGIRIYGVDSHPSVLENNRLQKKHLIENSSIPYPDDTFDIVISTWVLEHLEDPECTFKEISRVLKPGGQFLFLTCNKYHYVSIIARFTPQWFHEFLIPKIRGRSRQDVFPTYYKSNSESSIYRLSKSHGFKVEQLIFQEPPPLYLGFSTITFHIGRCYQIIVSKYNFLKKIRHGIVGHLVLQVSN